MSDKFGDDQALLERFHAEMQDLYDLGATFPFSINSLEAFQLLAALQLALRHPGVTTSSSVRFLREFSESLERALCAGHPAIAEVARRGWLEEHDALPARQ